MQFLCRNVLRYMLLCVIVLPEVTTSATSYDRGALTMINNFLCKETESIWEGISSRKLPFDMQQVARRKLRMLNNANTLQDLRIPPNNRLEALKGDRKDQHSIRINNRWRICFIWHKGMAHDVIIVDYH